jgi:hypothetical protein
MTRDEIAEHYPEALLLEPEEFDTAIVGVAEQAGGRACVVYDPDLCVQALMDTSDMDEQAALEFFEFNTASAYMGEFTPLFLYRGREGGPS